MIVICITGQRGSGKSTLINQINSSNLKNFKTFNADEFISESYKIGQEGFNLINNQFGSIYNDEFGINKQKLSQAVFNDHHIYESLISLTNPLIKSWIKKNCLHFLNSDYLIFELAIYLKFEQFYLDVFNRVILLTNKLDVKKLNHVSDKLLNLSIKFDYSIDINSKSYIKKIISWIGHQKP